MALFFSKTTNGFYDSDIHEANTPSDSVEITKEQHTFLLDAQSTGKRIVGDVNGFPEVIESTDSRTYAEKRAGEYPPVTDYLDGVVKGDQTQIDTYVATCLAVKTKYPKI